MTDGTVTHCEIVCDGESLARGGAGSQEYGAGVVDPYRAVTEGLAGAPAVMPAVPPQAVDLAAEREHSWWAQAGVSAFVLLPAAFFEELFVRGYAFSVIRRFAGWKLALISTSILFGLLHVWNPGADAAGL